MDIFKITNPNQKLSKNFTAREFMCKCNDCNDNKISMQLIQLLQYLRDELGCSIRITSGYRCPEHNERVGGRPSSQHLKGLAVDIQISDRNKIQDAERICNKLFAGLGIANTFIHVDVRDNKKARWVY